MCLMSLPKKKKYFIPYLPKPYIIIILNILQF